MPKFKRKKARQSYTTNNVNNSIRVDFEKGTISIPKGGEIKAKLHRTFRGVIKSTTIEKTTTGKNFVSILVEVNRETQENMQQTNKICAIDLGLKDFAVIVDSEYKENSSSKMDDKDGRKNSETTKCIIKKAEVFKE